MLHVCKNTQCFSRELDFRHTASFRIAQHTSEYFLKIRRIEGSIACEWTQPFSSVLLDLDFQCTQCNYIKTGVHCLKVTRRVKSKFENVDCGNVIFYSLFYHYSIISVRSVYSGNSIWKHSTFPGCKFSECKLSLQSSHKRVAVLVYIWFSEK
jgi:hypothetical protein